MTPSSSPHRRGSGPTRRDFLALTGLSSTALALASCGTPELPPADPANPTATGSAPRDVPRGRPPAVPREQTLLLSYGDGSDLGICNPYASGFNHQRGLAAMLEPLWFYSAFTGQTTAWLADGDPTYARDFSTVTITVRDDARWSDDTPFSARDVAFSLEMLKAEKNEAMVYSADIREWVEQAEATDDQTVTITFTKPAPRFVFDFLYFKNDLGIFLVPEHIFAAEDDQYGFTFYDPGQKWPVVTGPYQVVDWTVQQRLLDRRDDWWAIEAGLAQPPGPRRILVVPFTDSTNTAQQLINNELDSSLDLRPPVIKQVVEQNPHIIAWTDRNPPFGYTDWWPQSLFFNCAVPPYDDLEIRRAINHSINRQQLVDIGYEGAGTASTLPFPEFPPLAPFRESIQPLLGQYPTDAYDLGRVDAIMSGKGYVKDGDGLWTKDGGRVDATIYGIVELVNDYGAILAEQLRAAGFEASLQTPGDATTRIIDGSAKLFLFGFAGAIADPYPSLELMHSRHFSPIGEPGDVSSHWQNSDFDEIVEQMASLPVGDPQELALFGQAMEIYLRELPHTPLVQWLHRIPYNTRYWSGWPTASDPYLPGAFWFKTFSLELTRLRPTGG